jgi:serine/threonine-protein kinase
VIGTPNYMAPEQSVASSEVDHRADLYALGVVFYERLVGSPPAQGGLAIPPSRGGKVERRWDRVVMRALEQDPERRYQNGTQIKTAVEAVLAEQKRWMRPEMNSSTSSKRAIWRGSKS